MFDNPEVEETFVISIIGMHCQIWEPRHMPSSDWCSEQFNKARLACKPGIAMRHNQLAWIW
jgi:hypothetical protein